MKWINFHAVVTKAMTNIAEECKQRGYKVDVLDISENANIEFTDIDTVIFTYKGDQVRAKATFKIEEHTLRIAEIMIEMDVE